MRLSSLRLQNFRSCSDVTVRFDGYTCLIGPNGAGKSTILTALNILFRNTTGAATDVAQLDREDFCSKNVDRPIVITATFTDLSDEERQELAAYVRQNQLVLSAKAVWNEKLGFAEVRQYGSRLVMSEFSAYFEAEKNGAKAAELKSTYSGLSKQFSELPPANTKAAMEEALRSFEEAHPELCELVDSEDQFYGWSKGINRLSKFIQWIYIPAVKDAASEQEEARNTALGDLLQRTIRTKVTFDDALTELHEQVSERYAAIVDKHQAALQELGDALEARLQRWAHPGSKVQLQWNTTDTKLVSLNPPMARISIGEHHFIGEVARSGHGMQRAFIVSLLQELADARNESDPKLLLGFEEPELYQHPPQARHLAGLLEELSSGNAQIVVTTHSPYFVTGKGFEAMRMVKKNPGDRVARVTQLTHAELANILADALGEDPQHPTALSATVEQILQPSQNEMFFCRLPVLVEGLEDIAFIATHLQLSDRWRDFRKHGCHFVVALGKTNLSRPLAITRGLGLPAFAIFDGDSDDANNQAAHERDNGCILRLCGHASAPVWPNEIYWAENLVMWSTKIGKEVMADLGTDRWDAAEQHARSTHGLAGGVKRKNSMLIAATLETLWREGHRSTILDQTCERLISYSARV